MNKPAMSQGKTRRVRILAFFREHGRATGEILAREMSASVRTVYRDIAELQAYGLPIDGRVGDGYVWRGHRVSGVSVMHPSPLPLTAK